jgi:hypothetical protein
LHILTVSQIPAMLVAALLVLTRRRKLSESQETSELVPFGIVYRQCRRAVGESQVLKISDKSAQRRQD